MLECNENVGFETFLFLSHEQNLLTLPCLRRFFPLQSFTGLLHLKVIETLLNLKAQNYGFRCNYVILISLVFFFFKKIS